MKKSSGIIVYKQARDGVLHVLIAHMGGPFWAKKDNGGWSIPKGELDGDSDDLLAVAVREFEEELGSPPLKGEYIELGELRQPSGKRIIAFALEGDFDPENITSNTFEMEWPRGSGKIGTYPEIDRAAWQPAVIARSKLVKGQVGFIDRLIEKLAERGIEVSEGAEAQMDETLF
ncbi:MAG: NUDIX domain-containing protein [Pseudonocardiales bacterium]